ncbi:HSF-type DNA-binding protein [Nitzschia inconspicua]|uniref:HSF-type DNA-binding protein n=1 Tax=Nitzschia inconspicua TaxID=303405 RepID=A0A9K3LL74_9STRA|nr:HSF-type DNA-binding protein [Nitzschia inconspicua]KAG7364097.1 HSF-type DNA-binding protein [Nitzschia inconspicua]
MEHLSIENASPDLSFPWRLYILLRDSETEFPNVISWLPNSQGRVFQIHDIKAIEPVLQKYFSSGRYPSFRRQLIAYGFSSLGNRQYMHEEFSQGNPQGCEKLFRHMKSQPRQGKKAAAFKQKQQMVQIPQSHGPSSPAESDSYISYTKMFMARISQLSSRISPDLGAVNATSPRHGISVSPETLQLSPSSLSTQAGASPTQQQQQQQQYPSLQQQSQSPAFVVAQSNRMSSSGENIPQENSSSAFITSTNPTAGLYSVNAHVNSIDIDSELIDMDFEPLPFHNNDPSSGSTSVGESRSYSGNCLADGRKLPIMTDTLQDFNQGTSKYSKDEWVSDEPLNAQSLNYAQIEEKHSLQQLWKAMTVRVDDFLQPRSSQNLMTYRPTVEEHEDAFPRHALEQLLEPRRIEDMVARPRDMPATQPTDFGRDIWFDSCPSMTPEQQGIIEYMLPVFLPALFHMSSMSLWGYAWALLLIVGHSIECMVTDWGGNAWTVVPRIGPLQHLQMDLLWNHAMITSFFLCGPSIYGKNCFYMALGLIPTLPTLCGADLKSHLFNYILTDTEKEALATHDIGSASGLSAFLLQKRLAQQIQKTICSYVVAMFLLGLSSFIGNSVTQCIAVFFFNTCPLLAEFSYWKEFSDRLAKLPPKKQTVIKTSHVDWLRSVLGTGKHPKVKCT